MTTAVPTTARALPRYARDLVERFETGSDELERFYDAYFPACNKWRREQERHHDCQLPHQRFALDWDLEEAEEKWTAAIVWLRSGKRLEGWLGRETAMRLDCGSRDSGWTEDVDFVFVREDGCLDFTTVVKWYRDLERYRIGFADEDDPEAGLRRRAVLHGARQELGVGANVPDMRVPLDFMCRETGYEPPSDGALNAVGAET